MFAVILPCSIQQYQKSVMVGCLRRVVKEKEEKKKKKCRIMVNVDKRSNSAKKRERESESEVLENHP